MSRPFLHKKAVSFDLSQTDRETLGEHPNTKARQIVEEWCANERKMTPYRANTQQEDFDGIP